MQARASMLVVYASQAPSQHGPALASQRACHGGRDDKERPDIQELMDMLKRTGAAAPSQRLPDSGIEAEAGRAVRDPAAMLLMGQGMPFAMQLKLRDGPTGSTYGDQPPT